MHCFKILKCSHGRGHSPCGSGSASSTGSLRRAYSLAARNAFEETGLAPVGFGVVLSSSSGFAAMGPRGKYDDLRRTGGASASCSSLRGLGERECEGDLGAIASLSFLTNFGLSSEENRRMRLFLINGREPMGREFATSAKT